MTGKLSDYGADLAFTDGVTSGTLTVGLATDTITDDMALASVTESAFTNYARQSVTFSAPYASTTKRAIKNEADITFPQSGSSASAVTQWFVTDGTGVVAYGATQDQGGSDTSLQVINGSVIKFEAESLVVTLD